MSIILAYVAIFMLNHSNLHPKVLTDCVLHCPLWLHLPDTCTGVPPASAQIFGLNAHTRNMVSHCPPCNPQIVFSYNGGMTKLARKISTRIANTVKTVNAFVRCNSLTKYLPNHPLFTLEEKITKSRIQP